MTTIDRLSIITPINTIPGPPQGQWTYRDYAALPDDGKRYEIMDGVLLMAPSPGQAHQNVSMVLSFHLYQHVNLMGIGKLIAAPFDVELKANRVFQPDLLVVLNAHFDRLTANRLVGPPDLVIEITSPGTAAYDRLNKYQAYSQAGVPEYWLVDTEARSVEVLILAGNNYQSGGILQGNTEIRSQLFPGLSLRVSQLFS